MKMVNRPRGTTDIYPPHSFFYQKIRQLLEATLTKNNFQPLIFPTYEYAELFNTSLGSATDIIHKEMFTFPDRKGRNLALRPEGTVGVARLILQNRLFAAGYPLKFYYWANMFRYERPQKGRYREFWQLGVELVNAAGVRADYQILKLVQDIFAALGINQFTCNLNYLGSKSTQEKYKLELRKFLAATTPDLCDDCRRRAEENPLRILDCNLCPKKVSFPNYQMAWSPKDHDYWQELQQILTRFNFPYQVNHHLVRGLDYYTGLVFEIDLGEEKAVLGGGRYDQLFQQLGGIALPAAGFAIGIDRLVNYCEEKQLLKSENQVDIFFLLLDTALFPSLLTWKNELEKDFLVEYNLNNKKKSHIPQIIAHYQPKILVVLGEKILLKDCRKNQEFLPKKEKLIEQLYKLLKEN